MYDIYISKTLNKFFVKHKNLTLDIISALDILARNPYKNNLDTKKIQGYNNHYRLMINKYRVLYEITETDILIYACDVQDEVLNKIILIS